MFSAVIVLSLVVAMDPVRIGIAALLISRPRPMLNLFTFWLGGMAAGITVPVVVLLFLRDFASSLMRHLTSAFSSPIAAYVQISLGVLAVSIAALIAARFAARQHAVQVPGGRSPVVMLEPNTVTGSTKRSIRGQLEGAALVVAFVAGLGLATPPVEYLAAIVAILASGGTAVAQFGAALMFTLVAFTVVEVPLITYLAIPARTLAIVHRVNVWIYAHRQAIPAAVVGVIGVLLMATGMGRA